MKKFVLLIIIVMCSVQVCCSAGGSSPFGFLMMDVSAMTAALGSAYTAVPGDVHALHYNPAGLSGVSRSQLLVTYNQWYQDVIQQYAAYTMPSGIAVSINTVQYGEANRTTITDPNGTDIYTIEDSEVKLGFGFKACDRISCGVGVKSIQERIDTFTGQAVAVDIGLLAGGGR